MPGEPSGTEHIGLQQWLQELTEREMPAFASTTRVISQAASGNDRSAAELAELILQDVSMTTRVLRMANSIIYNPARNAISTVSRAIVVLGFEAVRSICMSIKVIDAMREGTHGPQVMQQLARAFHAAAQARALAERRKDKSPEEVFIAALLYHLGQMVFWSFVDVIDPAAARRLQQAAQQYGADEGAAQQAALGFRLDELTAALNEEWHLSPLLEQTLNDAKGEHPRVHNVILGQQLAQTAERGWETPEMRKLIERTAESLYLPLEQVKRMVHETSVDAAQSMIKLGASKAGKLIPQPSGKTATADSEAGTAEQEEQQRFMEPDPALQLKVLRELSQVLMDKQTNVTLLFDMVLEGIYRGIGMDRTLFALFSPDRKSVRAKHTLGWDRGTLAEAFHFRLGGNAPNLIDHIVTQGQPLWVPNPRPADLARLITPEIENVCGDAPFFLMPLLVREHAIGLFYADRRPSRRSLDEAAFTDFKVFVQQAALGLSYLKGRG